MASQKLEYDDSLGGRETLPTHVSTYHYAAGALQEIKSLIEEAQLPASSKLIFQTLPKHMRRRAMSHHPKRLPRKYRAAHKSQMGKAGNQPVNRKRPSRKYRRRPKNLMREYVRRQRKQIWLETHIWHAKRFHMINRWGFRLPLASCDKTFRACYRASASHCLLQDMSFYSCVQLRGSLELIAAGFSRLTSKQCGLGIAAKTFVSGYREGHIDLFMDGQYPMGALQRASFIWRREKGGEETLRRTLWLWLHPASSEATIAQLISVFQLKSDKQQKLPMQETEKSESKEQPLRFWTLTKALERYRTYVNDSSGLEMQILQQEFNRFRLTGDRCQSVLAASLRGYPFSETTHWLKETGMEPETYERQTLYCQSVVQQNSHKELLSNMIMGFNVVDPRLQRPTKRSMAYKSDWGVKKDISAVDRPACLPDTLLWNSDFRERLSQKMLSAHKYEQLRQQCVVVPGEKCAFEEQVQPVPVLLIQRPGVNDGRLGYGSGWDVIVPADYGMVFWKTFIMWGARVGGLREYDSVARESGAETHLPDTIVGKQLAALADSERRVRYFRLPPNKRSNYRKLAVVSPFTAPWEQLVRDWRDVKPTTGFYVMRDVKLLHEVKLCVRFGLPYPRGLDDSGLIQIRLRLECRGDLKANALICLPTKDDWDMLGRRLKASENAPVHCEPPMPDCNERLRKELRLCHKQQLKRLRARRVREKRKLQETSTRRVHIRPAQTSILVRQQFEKMCRLWLPTDPAETRDSVRYQCSREVCGYVTSAGFSYSEGGVCGVGYLTARALHRLIKEEAPLGVIRRAPFCLVRNADSLAYQVACIEVV